MTSETERRAAINEFLAAPILARMATVSTVDGQPQPHVVPVWYWWDGERIWISSYDSTRKVRQLEHNPHLSVVVDVDPGEHGLRGVLLEGRAELVRQPRSLVHEISTRIYTRYLGPEGVLEADPQEWIHADENLLISLAPTRLSSWS